MDELGVCLGSGHSLASPRVNKVQAEYLRDMVGCLYHQRILFLVGKRRIRCRIPVDRFNVNFRRVKQSRP